MIPAEETLDGTWPFTPHFSEASGFRQHYVDEGPREAQVLICLNGEPTWGYLYRHFIPRLSQLKREKRISEFQQRDSNRNSKTYFKVADAGSSTDEDAAFGDEKSSQTHVGNIPPIPPARTYARAGERVGKGGDGAYVEPTNLRSDCPACAGEGCRHC